MTGAYFIPAVRVEMAVTVIFVKLIHKEFSTKVLRIMLSRALHALYKDDSLIRGAGLVCSLAVLETVILRRRVGVVFDSVNSSPFLACWEEICRSVGRLYSWYRELCKSHRCSADNSCGRVES